MSGVLRSQPPTREARAAMKAVFFRQHGDPDELQYGEMPDPVPGPGEVLVDVHAASVNGADWRVVAGGYGPVKFFPYIPGRDFSGVVRALGPGVTDFKVGDAVFGVCDVGIEAAYAEQVVIKASILAHRPAGLTHVEAAAVALIGLTALCAVEDTLQVRAGETVLVQGGAGGVASFAIQAARHAGCRVASTTSTANVDYVKSLGTDQVIDYTREDFTQVLSGIDAVFDTVGGEVATRAYAVLKPGGRAAFIASGPKAPPTERTDVTGLRPAVGRDRAHLDRIAMLVSSGAVRVPEITPFPLADAARANAVSRGRHFRGKLVLVVR
jgi:NADPH:quinone reductase-like Zn-dependent oxidoreductase